MVLCRYFVRRIFDVPIGMAILVLCQSAVRGSREQDSESRDGRCGIVGKSYDTGRIL